MDAIRELQEIREQLILEVDRRIDEMIEQVRKMPETRLTANREDPLPDSTYSLKVGTTFFKGKKPTGIILADGRHIHTPTWKKVVAALMHDCDNDPVRHQKLLNLRGKLQGRDRVLLACEKGKMHSPLEISDNLY